MKLFSVFLSFALTMAFSASASESNFSEWKKLDPDAKLQSIFDYKLQEEEIDTDEISSMDVEGMDLQQISQELFLDAVENVSSSEVDSDVGYDTGYVVVGPVEATALTLWSMDNQIVAATVKVFQKGGYMWDGVEPESLYFASTQEAEAAGIDVKADVCWSGKATYEILPNGKWSALSYENSQGRGLIWCGW